MNIVTKTAEGSMKKIPVINLCLSLDDRCPGVFSLI